LDDYGKLARLKKEDLQAGKRVDLGEKKNKTDFALWKFSPKGKKREMEWVSPWGTGFPGWHIECSAMSMKYLGERFDIHCGGIDHIPVHHTNELAQSESATGKKPVNYWLHNEFLIFNKGKMAKSGKSFITLATLEKKGFNPLDYRYFCLGTVYRNPLMFSWEALGAAKTARKKLIEKVLTLKAAGKGKVNRKFIDKFTKEINDDLNTPKALATLYDLLKDNKITNQVKYSTILELDKVLGLGLKDIKKDKIPAEITKLAKERLKARENKDWKKADKLRDKIQKLGYIIGDTKEGYEISKD
jgi:cysteinyl-tRNA synthetase